MEDIKTIRTNYSIGELIGMKKCSNNSEEICYLLEKIECYKDTMEARVKVSIDALDKANPDNRLRWIQENTPADIRAYLCAYAVGKEYDVLKKSEKKYKTISDIGIEVCENTDSESKCKEWLEDWKNEAEKLLVYISQQAQYEIKDASVNQDMTAVSVLNVYETHAHYNLKNYNGCREELLQLMHAAGISDIVIPAVEYSTNQHMKELFDGSEYSYIKYAFGSHPKYIWKEKWDVSRWLEYRELLKDDKCVAVGESGLDYSYIGFCDEHRTYQKECFNRFIDAANEAELPLILHIREADADALDILRANRPMHGAVLHCFGGSESDVERYMNVGVTHFGIGGRICYGDFEFEKAVSVMPEESIVLETDSPYIKLAGDRVPNTSLSLLDIATKIASIRNTTVANILNITYNNAVRLFAEV